MDSCVIDHITITSPTLEAGANLVKKSLGVAPEKGGEHPRMATHNLLLRLGNDKFLEVIAINPAFKNPLRPRWFALDELKVNTPPQLKTWVVRTDDINSTLSACSEDLGEIQPMSRGKVHWKITIPKDGSLPVQEGAPSLIQWQATQHPATQLTDYGLSLARLEIIHPEPERLTNLHNSIGLKEGVHIRRGAKTKIIAHINTPGGLRQLHC